MKTILLLLSIVLAALLFPALAVADSIDVLPSDFLAQVLEFIKTFGGLPSVAKISGVILLLIASMKVSVIRSYVWDRLGAFKAFAAPTLGLIAGVISLETITLPGLATYLFAGAGAIILHEILDAVKSIPGIGAIYVSIIDFIKKILPQGKAK